MARYQSADQRIRQLETLLQQRSDTVIDLELQLEQKKQYVGRLHAAFDQEVSDRNDLYRDLQQQKFALDQAAMVLFIDKTGQLSYANEAFFRRSLYLPEQLLQHPFSIADAVLNGEQRQKEVWSTITAGNVWKGELVQVTSQQQQYWVDATIVPIVGEQGEPSHYLAILFDITAIKQAELEAISTSRIKSDFIANISHELRTPLHAIMSFATMGRDKAHDLPMEKVQIYFSRVLSSGKRLLRLIDNVLDFSKLQANKLPLQKTHCDMIKIMYAVKEDMQALLDDNSMQLTIETKRAQQNIFCDEQQLQQVFTNLLGNAIKYSEYGANIVMTCVKKKEMICCQCIDNGRGIDEQDLQRIFEPFTRGHDTKQGVGGTGLGLSICRAIVEAHGGEIFVQSTVNQGTTFTILLPEKESAK